MTKWRLSALAATIIFVTIACSHASAQTAPPAPPSPPTQTPANQDFDLNSVLMECTFMVEGKNAQGQPIIGTSFIMGRPLPNQSPKAKYVLITAGHVFNDMVGDTAILHLRRKVGENNFVHTPIPIRIRSNGHPIWIKHPDADVAVMYIRLPSEIHLPLLSTSLLADDKMLSDFQIHPGDDLECLGFPLGFKSNEAWFPILRSGKIASYPLLPTASTKTFLFDFRVFKGNSGGPVYYVGTSRNYQGAIHVSESIRFIIGLVSEEESFQEVTIGVYDQQAHQVQLGLAIVVHASLIRQAIDILPAPETIPD